MDCPKYCKENWNTSNKMASFTWQSCHLVATRIWWLAQHWASHSVRLLLLAAIGWMWLRVRFQSVVLGDGVSIPGCLPIFSYRHETLRECCDIKLKTHVCLVVTMPDVPHIEVEIPHDYPSHCPQLLPMKTPTTNNWSTVHAVLQSQLRNLPGRFTLTQLLGAWVCLSSLCVVLCLQGAYSCVFAWSVNVCRISRVWAPCSI